MVRQVVMLLRLEYVYRPVNLHSHLLAFFLQILDQLATGKISSPEEIAGLVSFLASPAARNITGML